MLYYLVNNIFNIIACGDFYWIIYILNNKFRVQYLKCIYEIYILKFSSDYMMLEFKIDYSTI